MHLTHMQVAAVNCQVVLFVPNAEEEWPQWPTGQELIVANSGAISVRTICDIDGMVEINVWRGEELPNRKRGPIHDGTLQVRDAGALVGSDLGDHLALLLLREGEHRVRVYTDPAGPYVEHVDFVID